MGLLLCAGQAMAGNVLKQRGTEVLVGGEGVVEIGCSFETGFTAFELQLSLSEGLTLVTDEDGKPVAECGFAGSHIVAGNRLASSGNYKFVCYSLDKSPLPMNGTLLRVRVKADEVLAQGSILTVSIVSPEFVRKADSEGEILRDKEMPVAVGEVKAARTEGELYDLQGRRAARAVRGVYIQGGRKVLTR